MRPKSANFRKEESDDGGSQMVPSFGGGVQIEDASGQVFGANSTISRNTANQPYPNSNSSHLLKESANFGRNSCMSQSISKTSKHLNRYQKLDQRKNANLTAIEAGAGKNGQSGMMEARSQ